MPNYLPFALPEIGQDEIDEVVDTLQSGWITTGPKVKQFEKLFCDFLGARFSVAVNSATAGLHLALEALGIGPGDKVITTPYTFTATAEVVRYLGADPVFVDIDKRTFNINVDLLEEYLVNCVSRGEKVPKGMIPVHFAGQACEMDRILELAKRFSLYVIEDAAHALPAEFNKKKIGTIGDITVFSFYATKTITTGEGGMLVTENSEWVARISNMRLHGINRDVFDRYTSSKPSWYYEVVAPGYKYNMPDIAAAIGLHQLRKAELFRVKRESIAQRYNEAFVDLPLQLPYISRPQDKHAWHLYVIQLNLEQLNISRDIFIDLLSEKGIGTSVHFIPLHLHPYWSNRYGFKPLDYPVAFHVYQRSVSLPIYSKMSGRDIGRVIDAVRDILLRHRRVVTCLQRGASG